MSAVILHDPDVMQKSAMTRRGKLCNGKQTGRQCTSYFAKIQPIESTTADLLKHGQIFRVCLKIGPSHGEMSDLEIPHTCNSYEPRKKRLLAMLRLVPDRGAYMSEFEEYAPLPPLPSNNTPLQGTALPVVDESVVRLSEAFDEDPPLTVEALEEKNIADFEAEIRKVLDTKKENS